MKLACLAVLVALAGCASTPHYKLALRAAAAPPKPAGCNFQVLTTAPATGYQELGTLDLADGQASDPDAFKAAVRAQVCHAGGDAVVTRADDRHAIAHGTILRSVTPTVLPPKPAGTQPGGVESNTF